MEKAKQEESKGYIVADDLVRTWMHAYKAYLLDGDPNILHPKARAALTLAISDALLAARPKAAPKAKALGDA